MFKNGLVPKSCYFGTMVQLVQESPTLTQWRNVTLCRPPADCNLPPLSGAGLLRSPKFVRRDTILFSANLS